MKFLVIISFLLNFFSFNFFAFAETFTVVGHTQYLESNKKKYEIFIKKFNELKSDYIFFLGDSNLGKPDIFYGLSDKTKKKIFSVPGNGEYRNGIESYLDNIGYLNKDLETKNFIFLLLDSNQSTIDIQNILKSWKKRYYKSDKIVVLLTHHRIWDDSIISAHPYKHDKTFYFRDIYPLIKGFVNYIIAGNSKRQYFQDLPESLKNNQIPNISTTYWEENFQDIKAYNIGMGNGIPYASFVSFELFNKNLIPISKTFKVSNEGLDKQGLIDLDSYKTIIRDKGNNKLTIIEKLFIYFEKYQSFILGFISGLFFLYVVLNIKNSLIKDK